MPNDYDEQEEAAIQEWIERNERAQAVWEDDEPIWQSPADDLEDLEDLRHARIDLRVEMA